jgi:Mevalonate kinase
MTPRQMPVLRVSAPGKLFLLGEYAVLEGAPALLSAVDARVQVSVSTAAGGCWRVATPGLDLAPQELGPDGELPGTMEEQARRALRVFDAVRGTLLAAGRLTSEPRDVVIDSSAFSRNGRKLGLGSSAAVAVALTAALTTAPTGPQLDRSALFALADTAHRLAQGGTGSGGDVAASVYGGLISYTTRETPTQLGWPEGLAAMAVVTGDGSSTMELVARVNAYRDRDERGYRSDIRRLADLADRARAALGSAADFLALCSDYFLALGALDTHAQAGIVTERHRELREIAAASGGVFKSSGAGGGDLGLAFTGTGAPADELRRALSAAGAELLPFAFCAEGVRAEEVPAKGNPAAGARVEAPRVEAPR